jgi:hypothetical protein
MARSMKSEYRPLRPAQGVDLGAKCFTLFIEQRLHRAPDDEAH